MTRKLLIALLIAAMAATPAYGKAKKKKGPKPWSSPQVTVYVPHTMAHGSSGTLVGVTPQEFMKRCAIPASNGFDAYVFAVPEEYRKVQSLAKAIGVPGPTGMYDLDMYLFDESCTLTLAYNPVNTDETGTLPKGTAYVLVHNYQGDPALSLHLELAPS